MLDLLSVVGLIVMADEAYHSCVISKLYSGVAGLDGGTVLGEESQTKHTALRSPVFRIMVADVRLPILTFCEFRNQFMMLEARAKAHEEHASSADLFTW